MARFVVRFIQSPRAACLSVLPPRALAICRKALINSNLRAELQDSPSFEARFLSCRINCQSGAWRTQSNFGLLRTATVERSGYQGWPNALDRRASWRERGCQYV